MRKLIVVNVAILLALLMNSCATSNDVVSNRLISKRKYTKGLFIKKNLKMKSDGVDDSENYAMRSEESNSTSENLNLNTREVQNLSSSRAADQMRISDDLSDVSGESENNSNYGVRSATTAAEQTNNENQRASVSTKEQKKEFKQQLKAKKGVDTGDPVMLVILIILAIILPPVAVGIYRGIDNIFWLDLILFLVGFGGFWFLPIAGLAALAAVIIAFLVIFDVI